MKIRDVIDAVEQNGLPKVKGVYLTTDIATLPEKDSYSFGANLIDYSNVQGGCALGQAGRNLGLNPNDLADNLGAVGEAIIQYNDETDMTLAEIAAVIRVRFANRMDWELEF